MLSKVAERIYWTARYLERIESTARLISIYDKLLFDLPRNVQLSWYNLITINSLQKDFSDRYAVQDERNVIKFLIGDESNYSSIISSLKAVRENVRTTRDVIPSDVWYTINELNLMDTTAVNHFFEVEKPEYVILAAAKVGGHCSQQHLPWPVYIREPDDSEQCDSCRLCARC